uniref:oxidoreductase n=1 Tax=Methylogaea oryzae TaxID=1295382 RepID=UPI0006CF838F
PSRPTGQAFIVDGQGQGGWAPFVVPRALETGEIAGIVAQYAQATRNALEAGFDGVEVHGANGYLLDQFINSNSNQRSDRYGGSVANRARLLLEVIEAVSEVSGAGRVGVRLSPLGTFNDMADADPLETFGYIAGQLDGCSLAYLHVVDPTYGGHAGPETADPRAVAVMASIRERFRGPLIVCGGYDQAKAEAALAQGRADLVAFGRPYIANPDLVKRFLRGAPLNTPDPDTFYGGGEAGYTDYPLLDG